MNNYTHNLNAFNTALQNGELKTAYGFLNTCFMEKPKSTLLELYKKGFLFKKEFLELGVEQHQFPSEYILLIKIIRINLEALDKATAYIKGFSKEQLLQGIANILEKQNTQLKYNAEWNVKYANADRRYLETERQSTYFSCAGIQFQEMLDQFYEYAPDQSTVKIDWNEAAIHFEELLFAYRDFVDLKDIIEKHLYFGWTLTALDSETLKAFPADQYREGSPGRDFLHNLKSKQFMDALDVMVHQQVAIDLIKGKKSEQKKNQSNLKYKPENDLEKEWLKIAEYFAAGANMKVEQELAMFKRVHFPGLDTITDLELNSGAKLPLRDLFNITSFLCELSRHHIEDIDKLYTRNVNYFSTVYNSSKDAQEIAFKSLLFKGDEEKLKQMLAEHCTDEVNKENAKIISESKNSIPNELCLLRYDYKSVIKALQWIYQYDESFIKQTIGLFTFEKSSKGSLTHTPFFIVGEQLCWMPNMIAFVPFSELLLENSIEKKLITIHKVQTDYYERNLKFFFKSFGYKVIECDQDKEMKVGKENPKGDFDLLAWKEYNAPCP
jgi:hypothetical protein